MSKQTYPSLKENQRQIVEYLVKKCSQKKGILLFHLMGTGKTKTAIAWSKNFKTNCVIIVPDILTSDWKREIELYTPPRQTNVKVISTKKKSFRTQSNRSSAHIHSNRSTRTRSDASYVMKRYTIYPHEYFFNHFESIDLQGKNVIIDEAQMICPWYTQHSQKSQIFSCLRKSKRLVLLSGTPFMYERHDICTLVNLVQPEDSAKLPMSDKDFIEKYMRKDTTFTRYVNQVQQFFTIFGTPVLGFMQTAFGFILKPAWKTTSISAFVSSLVANRLYLAVIFIVLILNMIIRFITIDKKYLYTNARLDMEKFSEDIKCYVDFYDIGEHEQKDYPSFKEETVVHKYSTHQQILLLNLLHQERSTLDILRFLIDNPHLEEKDVDHAWSLVIGDPSKATDRILKYGRNIGNLSPSDSYPEKFTNIYDKFIVPNESRQDDKKRMLFYSNFRHAGCERFVEFLSEKQLDCVYYQKSLSDDEKKKAKTRRYIVIDEDSQAGVDFQEIEELHVLDPPLSYASYLQIIYRAIRYRSHASLSFERQNVKIYNHQCIVTYCPDIQIRNLKECLLHAWDIVEHNIPYLKLSYQQWLRSKMKDNIIWLLNRTGSSEFTEFTSPDLMVSKKLAMFRQDYADMKNVFVKMNFSSQVSACCKEQNTVVCSIHGLNPEKNEENCSID
jgi:hypothetical protein